MGVLDIRTTVGLSIDAALGVRNDLADSTAIGSTCLEILNRLAELELPATWGLDEVGASRLADHVAGTEGQELALLCPRASSETSDSRKGISTLPKRLAAMRRPGQGVTTIVGDGWTEAEDLELLVRCGLNAVRTTTTAPLTKSFARWPWSRRPSASEPRPLRWGLRQFIPTLAMPEASLRAARRAIELAAKSQGPVVLAIDVSKLAAPSRGLRGVMNVLDRVARYRDCGHVAVMTLGDVVARLDRSMRRRPTQSILRPSAA